MSSGMCAVCDGVLDQPTGQRLAWDWLGPVLPVRGRSSPSRASKVAVNATLRHGEEVDSSQRALEARALEAQRVRRLA